LGSEHRKVYLGADLKGVAAIHKYAGNIRQHSGVAAGAGEAGEPREALVTWGDIFATVGISARDEEAIKLGGGQRGAQPPPLIRSEVLRRAPPR
jgi:hypothetical protein